MQEKNKTMLDGDSKTYCPNCKKQVNTRFISFGIEHWMEICTECDETLFEE